MTSPDAPVLTLPLPRWPWAWPLAITLLYAAQGGFNAIRLAAEGGPWRLALALLTVLFFLFWGACLAVIFSARHWRELRVEPDRLVLVPVLAKLPTWARWAFDPGARQLGRQGHLEVPRSHASLEWVGRTLLLHGNPEVDVRLGRGARAEAVVDWLRAQGLPDPVGR